MNDIRRWIQRRSHDLADRLTSRELFNSPEFSGYVNDVVETVLGSGCGVRAVLEDGGENGPIGCTAGSRIWINTSNRVAEYYNLLESKFAAFMGVVLHECGHVKYHNFTAEQKELEKLKQGSFPGEPPEVELPGDPALIGEVAEALADPACRPIFERVYGELSNIVDDVHDEGKMIDRFGGFVAECIRYSAESTRAACCSLEEMEGSGMAPLSIAFNVMLQFLRFSSVLSVDGQSAYTSEYFRSLYRYSRHAWLARWTDSQAEKMTHLNYVVLALWPFIREELEKKKPDSGDPGRDGPNQGRRAKEPVSPQAVQNVLDQLRNGARNAGGTVKPVKRRASRDSRAEKGSGENNARARGEKEPKPVPAVRQDRRDRKPGASVEEMMRNAAGRTVQSIAESEAEQQISAGICREVNVPSMNSCHRDVPVEVRRDLNVEASDVAEYEAAMKDLRLYSRNIRRQILALFRNHSEGELARHKLYGNRFLAEDAYRADQRMFASRKQPRQTPDLAVAILVDCSGSMNGERLRAAKRAAMLLYDFADSLDIPVMAAGHSTRGQTVVYTVAAPFEKASGKDRYRISRLEAGGSNRDGLAIEKTIGLLAGRPEEMKLLFIISDGQPAHRGYGGEEARKDIQAIVARGKRAGVETIAAAIGSDREKIESIYKDGYLDIDDLSALPVTLARLVRKRLLR